jgi:hypothetical protein
MMKKEMEKIDMPDVREFLDILSASGVKLWPANWLWICSATKKKTCTMALKP